MYHLDQFALMFTDRIRMDAYAAAIQKSVKPGDTVVDLGSGLGIFALLACKAGARRVYAIETNPVVDFGRHLATVNGFGDRIHFLRGDSRQIHLPERADVVVSDLRGTLPLFTHAVDTIQDARNRFLAEDGQLIPLSDTLVCAVVEHPRLYEEIAGAWRAIPELDLSSGLPLVLNGLYCRRLKPEQVVSGGVAWRTLNYTARANSIEHGTVQATVLRNCLGHGLGQHVVEGVQVGPCRYGASSGSLTYAVNGFAHSDGLVEYGLRFVPVLLGLLAPAFGETGSPRGPENENSNNDGSKEETLSHRSTFIWSWWEKKSV